MRYLRQSTAQTERIGPYLDVTDGVTEEIALTPATELSKDGAAFVVGPVGVHDAEGWYLVAFTTGNTDTLGSLMIKSQDAANHVPVWHEFMVFPANVYDALVLDTDSLTVDAEAIADQVWDEILTGATHNIPSSAGRRLRTLQDFGVYEGGAVWIDTVNGTPGTVDFENGTVNNPVDSIADALTIAGSVGLMVFHVLPGSSFTLTVSVAGFEFVGFGYTVALGGQSISGTLFVNATITGNDTGANAIETDFRHCEMGNNVLGKHGLRNCNLLGTITLAEAAAYFWDQCYSGVAGSGAPSVDYQAVAEVKTLAIRHYSGGMELKNHGAGGGTHTTSLEGHGQLVINANCVGGNVNVRGHFKITETGTVTLTDRVNFESILDDGTTVYDRTTDSLQEVRDLSAAGVAVLPGGITTGSFAAGAINAASVAADAVNKIAAAIGPQKNQALNDLEFLMVLSSDAKTPAPGLTVTGQRSLDGAAFVAVSGTIAEVGNGIYQFDALAADMNADLLTFRFSSGTALDTNVTIKTTP